MKITYLLSAVAFAALFSSCSKENDEPANGKRQEVRLIIDESVTRTITNGNSTTFVEGDAIGITSSGLDIDMSNATYTVGTNGSLNGGSFYYKDNNSARFYAHYPADAVYASGTVMLSVPANQNTEAAFNACDFMTATATGTPTTNGGQVVLKFKHRLALVKVVWNGSATATAVRMSSVKPMVTWTQATDVYTTGGDAIDINLWKIGAGQEYWGMIPEQTIAEGSRLLTISDGDKDYEYTTAKAVSFSTGTIKKITLNLNQGGGIEAHVSDIAIENWDENGDSEITGRVDEVEVPAVEIISEAAGKNIMLRPNSKASAAQGAWNVAVEEGNIIEVDNAEKAIHFKLAATNAAGKTSSWWNNAVYYRPSAETASRIMPTLYKLTFDAKASEAEKGFMIQVMKGEEKTNTYFGITNTDPSGKAGTNYLRMYYPSFTADQVASGYVTLTYWIDFSKVVSTDGKTITAGKAGDYGNVLLTLSINTGSTTANAYGTDFYFKNFKFVEVK